MNKSVDVSTYLCNVTFVSLLDRLFMPLVVDQVHETLLSVLSSLLGEMLSGRIELINIISSVIQSQSYVL